jgi:hypothetical protein
VKEEFTFLQPRQTGGFWNLQATKKQEQMKNKRPVCRGELITRIETQVTFGIQPEKETKMKMKLMLFATALALLVTTAASAQSISVKVNMPFSFIVNRITLPAGKYLVESVDNQGKALRFANLNSQAKDLVISNSCDAVNPAAQTKLIFHRYGDRYFLKRIWVAGNSAGHELLTSPRETEVAKDFSMQEVVLTAALR